MFRVPNTQHTTIASLGCNREHQYIVRLPLTLTFSYDEQTPTIESFMYDLTFRPDTVVDSNWNVMAHGDAREGKWRGNWRMEWVASSIHTNSEHGVSSITMADAHTTAASSRLNWLPRRFNPLNTELNPICYLLALLGAHHFLHVSRIWVKSLNFRRLMSYIYIYIYGAPILDVSRSHTTTQHSR